MGGKGLLGFWVSVDHGGSQGSPNQAGRETDQGEMLLSGLIPSSSSATFTVYSLGPHAQG